MAKKARDQRQTHPVLVQLGRSASAEHVGMNMIRNRRAGGLRFACIVFYQSLHVSLRHHSDYTLDGGEKEQVRVRALVRMVDGNMVIEVCGCFRRDWDNPFFATLAIDPDVRIPVKVATHSEPKWPVAL